MICVQGTYNTTIFKMEYEIDECDHSCLEIKLHPQLEGVNLFLHVLIGNQEVMESPKPISIVKSQKHSDIEKEQKEKKDLAKANKLQALKDKENEKKNKKQ